MTYRVKLADMKNVYVVSIAVAFFFVSVSMVEARSGCCSHHGGVCGCGCCDGTSLSTTCAPYYPQCNAPVINPKVFKTPTSTPKPTDTPKPSMKALSPISSPIAQSTNTSDTKSDNWTTAIVGSLVGAGAYHLFTKRKKDRG